LYNRGLEAWTEWRRLDYPVLVAPVDALSEIPVRYTYPVQEQNLNVTNYTEAASAIGGDEVTTKIFWDKF
jgi:Susd and RagB outer membrane lipoprotein